MNHSEKEACIWLKNKGQELVFQRRNTPDFIDSKGHGWEVKLLRGNDITFTAGQLEKLIKFGNATVLVMSAGKDPPVAQIPIAELKDSPAYWHQFHITSYPALREHITEHNCQDCGVAFSANQGSRTRYCPDCLLKRLTHPETRGRKGKKGERK